VPNVVIKMGLPGAVLSMALFGVVTGASVWFAYTAWNSRGDQQYLLTVFALSALLMSGLLVIGGCRVITTRLTDDHVERRVLISSRGIWTIDRMRWNEITEVSYSQMVFRLKSVDRAFNVHLGFFPDYAAAARFIESKVSRDIG